ncbi:DNA-methyltransferase [Aureibacillus halotolerans]|uniref:Methyltransferase n=1 Tax=Aureibacillus halotolerans TaxID=1508390 RepID=A0A4R6TQM9_9BACI|nr:site-specific DNA-methyltransferase [Aureibacillus halotolerans]TDQ35251.1 DNA modification methylase [Aureibacillus halotolerans]
METNKIYQGNCLDVLKTLPNASCQTVVTSPPYYGLRDYGVDGQLGLEETVEEYVSNLVKVFREVRRVLKDDGTVWLNLGDSYAGSGKGATKDKGQPKHKYIPDPKSIATTLPKSPAGLSPKNLIGIPWRVAFALQADGWILRSDVVWNKPNAMPESVRDRPTKAHEYIFLLAKNQSYYYDNDAIKEKAVDGDPNPPRGSRGVTSSPNLGTRKQDLLGKRTYSGFNARYKPLLKRNKRTVWTVATRPRKEAHFATFPEQLIEPCVLSSCPEEGVVLDPFFGAGTTGKVAMRFNRRYLGIELNPAYIKIAENYLSGVQMELLNEL